MSIRMRAGDLCSTSLSPSSAVSDSIVLYPLTWSTSRQSLRFFSLSSMIRISSPAIAPQFLTLLFRPDIIQQIMRTLFHVTRHLYIPPRTQDEKRISGLLALNDNRRQSFSAQAVSLKHAVMRNNAQFFDAGLSDEHSIERIPVHGRQPAGRYSMTEPDRQRSKCVSDDRIF